MGNGKLFLAVRAVIREKIKKEAGDYVKIKLYPDKSPTEIPEELLLCFEHETKDIYQNYTRRAKKLGSLKIIVELRFLA